MRRDNGEVAALSFFHCNIAVEHVRYYLLSNGRRKSITQQERRFIDVIRFRHDDSVTCE